MWKHLRGWLSGSSSASCGAALQRAMCLDRVRAELQSPDAPPRLRGEAESLLQSTNRRDEGSVGP